MNQPNQPQAWEEQFEKVLEPIGKSCWECEDTISNEMRSRLKAFISEQIAEAKREERERMWEFLMPSPKKPKP